MFGSDALAAIGSVIETKGTACEIRRGKSSVTGTKGAGIETMDTYITGICEAHIGFKDNTQVKVTNHSRLVIDDFVYDPRASDAGKLAIKVGMGTVRYASGQIAKNNPQKVNINTPSATVTVRGTDFTMTVDEVGRSLIVLVPSCKDQSEVKQYELQENVCAVGSITVSTEVGTVTLDQAFQATYVSSRVDLPTPPVVVNIVESKISNNLILVQPLEIQRAIKEAAKTPRDRELEEIEAEAARRLAQRVRESAEQIAQAQMLLMAELAGRSGCNATSQVCVIWNKPDEQDPQNRGPGVAFRYTENEHYAEVKTQGYESNTSITITHNDNSASTVIGNGSPGGNVISIRQSTGVRRAQ
jgi:hypothetical protein